MSVSLSDKAMAVLRQSLADQAGFIKVHAAENLLSIACRSGVYETFLDEDEAHGSEPQYRTGIWRVLACAAGDASERTAWLDKLRVAFFDVTSPDRLHAAESLAKINYVASTSERLALEQYIGENQDLAASVGQWLLANRREADDLERLAAYLRSQDVTARLLAAMGLQKIAQIGPSVWQMLASAASAEPEDSRARVYMLAAAFAVAANDQQSRALHAPLAQCLRSASDEDRKFAAAGFAQRGHVEDLPLLEALLDDADPDVRVYGAHAILAIQRRASQGR